MPQPHQPQPRRDVSTDEMIATVIRWVRGMYPGSGPRTLSVMVLIDGVLQEVKIPLHTAAPSGTAREK